MAIFPERLDDWMMFHPGLEDCFLLDSPQGIPSETAFNVTQENRQLFDAHRWNLQMRVSMIGLPLKIAGWWKFRWENPKQKWRLGVHPYDLGNPYIIKLYPSYRFIGSFPFKTPEVLNHRCETVAPACPRLHTNTLRRPPATVSKAVFRWQPNPIENPCSTRNIWKIIRDPLRDTVGPSSQARKQKNVGNHRSQFWKSLPSRSGDQSDLP